MDNTSSNASMRYASFGSIIVGVFIALTITTLLNFISLSYMETFPKVWIIFTSIVSMFAGGWTAGKMSDMQV